MEGGAGETALELAIADAYAYWQSRRPSARKEIPQGTYRQLKRALKSGYGLDQVQAMIDALLASEWHQARPETLKLSTIFATKPGGKTFEDQLDYWLERAGSPAPTPVRGPHTQGQIEMAKHNLRHGAAGELRQEAIDFLAQHAITVTWRADQHGREFPTFKEGA